MAFSNPRPRTFIVLLFAMILKKITSEIICQLMRSAATRTLFLGGKICSWGGQNFWVGLLFSEFSVDLKKKGHLAKLLYLSPSFLSVSKKKPPT